MVAQSSVTGAYCRQIRLHQLRFQVVNDTSPGSGQVVVDLFVHMENLHLSAVNGECLKIQMR